jgi:hypothetical protein
VGANDARGPEPYSSVNTRPPSLVGNDPVTPSRRPRSNSKRSARLCSPSRHPRGSTRAPPKKRAREGRTLELRQGGATLGSSAAAPSATVAVGPHSARCADYSCFMGIYSAIVISDIAGAVREAAFRGARHDRPRARGEALPSDSRYPVRRGWVNVKRATELFGMILPSSVRLFPTSQTAAGRSWISATSSTLDHT